MINKQSAQTPTKRAKKNVSLAGVSGKDANALDAARGDERAWSALVPLTVLAAALLHSVGLMAAIYAVGYDPQELMWAIAIFCGALALLDYRTASLRDYGLALQTARTLRPDMPSMFTPSNFATPIRWLMAGVFGMLLGGFLFLGVSKTDTYAELGRLQDLEDADLAETHREPVIAERDLLEEWVRAARAEMSLAEELDTRKEQASVRSAHLARLAELRAAQTALQADMQALEETASQARERMECEEEGRVTPRCPGATGTEGRETAWRTARDAADVAEAGILDLEVELAAGAAKIGAMEAETPSLTSAETPEAIRQAVKAVVDAERALGEFDVQAALQAQVEADPARRVYDPNALRDQMLALKSILTENPDLWWMVALMKAGMVALESLVLIMGLGARPTEYHVERAKGLILHLDESARAVRASYLDNQAQNARFSREVMEDDPKVVSIRRNLARESAREAAEGLRASEAAYTEHLVRGGRPHGIAAE
jgi:hypothetical protein